MSSQSSLFEDCGALDSLRVSREEQDGRQSRRADPSQLPLVAGLGKSVNEEGSFIRDTTGALRQPRIPVQGQLTQRIRTGGGIQR
ncbi:hypothetical protein AAFF_G00049520 [Aldrovandia affinis]|uniref:Uncharacterized protein n=1 Tax=Aldrovandia affinis TaxID=143900 RepID=A0AAD7S1P5_9TELE|nr:hypothetical protein AAFF_G00049520 [Aldrovandia affinis]